MICLDKISIYFNTFSKIKTIYENLGDIRIKDLRSSSVSTKYL